MRLEKRLIRMGDGATFPTVGDLIKVHYTGWFYDGTKPEKKGRRFDSSRLRGPFTTTIGVGQVVKGWDILVCQMSLGEKSSLEIPSEQGYGTLGFPGLIPGNTDLIFEVELLQITAQNGSNPGT